MEITTEQSVSVPRNMSLKVLRLPQVIDETGLSKSTIYSRIAEGTFPSQFPLFGSPRLSGWLKGEVDDWVQQQVDNERHSESATRSNIAPPSKAVKSPARRPSSVQTESAANTRGPQ